MKKYIYQKPSLERLVVNGIYCEVMIQRRFYYKLLESDNLITTLFKSVHLANVAAKKNSGVLKLCVCVVLTTTLPYTIVTMKIESIANGVV